MTKKEYLSQARHLDQRINNDIREVGELRRMAKTISASSYSEKISGSRPNEAGFTRAIEKVVELEEKINREIDLFVDLKEQMRNAIAALPNEDEQLVITDRFIYCETLETAAKKLNMSISTAKRRYNNAMAHFTIPENPIII